jgi:hypothetical protein
MTKNENSSFCKRLVYKAFQNTAAKKPVSQGTTGEADTNKKPRLPQKGKRG